MDCVLDLDLDFFVWPVRIGPCEGGRLPDADCRHLASAEEVRSFLESRCGLSSTSRLPGREFSDHVDAFKTWHEWLSRGSISSPFDVVHIDAHADLGAGVNLSLAYLDELLARPLSSRSDPSFGDRSLNCGNYLLGALANHWVHSLTYVYPTAPQTQQPNSLDHESAVQMERIRRFLNSGTDEPEPLPVRDLPAACFRDCDPRTNEIQLKGYKREEYGKSNPVPFCVEPTVPFRLVPASNFQVTVFTHMTVARSPQYTPRRADRLLPVIREYFDPT